MLVPDWSTPSQFVRMGVPGTDSVADATLLDSQECLHGLQMSRQAHAIAALVQTDLVNQAGTPAQSGQWEATCKKLESLPL